jgi:diacylglycerol kinase family enzyme
VNPRSGNQGLAEVSNELECWLQRRSGKLEVLGPETSLESGITLVGGGDGTLGAFLAQAANRTDTVLGFIPLGTGNDLCRELGIKMRPSKQLASYLDSLLSGRLVKLALWQWQHADRCGTFVNYISLGLDSFVVERFNSQRLRERFPYKNLGRWGNRFAYLVESFRFASVSVPELELISATNCKTLPSASGVLFCNVGSYMGLGRSNIHSDPFDNLMEACLFPNPLTYVKTVHTWLPINPPEFLGNQSQWQLKQLPAGLPLQSDGEFIGYTENAPLNIDFKGFAQILLPSDHWRLRENNEISIADQKS